MTYKKTILFASLVVATLIFGSVLAPVDATKNKDYKNYEAENIYKQLAPYLIQEVGKEKTYTENDLKEIDRLQKALDKAQNDHKEKFTNHELQKELKKAHKLISDSDIPFLILGMSNDGLIIQLAPENNQYERRIAEMLQGVPYTLEYGEGVKRSACDSTTDNCDPEIGGIKIQVSTTTIKECSLSIPMKKSGVPGFLTAGHCFISGTGYVYQPTTSTPSGYIGYSLASNRDFVDNGDCDCAWLKDTSSTPQQNGVFVYSGSYWVIGGTDIPALNDQAMLRGFHNNNGNWWTSNTIDVVGVTITQGGIDTVDVMGFPSPFQLGDSGGSVFYNGKYMGIAVASGVYNGVNHVFFIPWDNVSSSISGLGL